MQTIFLLLQSATDALRIVSDTPRLEAEILLADVLAVSRSHLHAWPEKMIPAAAAEKFLALIERRVAGEPIAYITGHQAFWTFDLNVTNAVLVPRPETELLVEWILKRNTSSEQQRIADLGTGTGAIGLALAYERPNWEIHATDFSHEALKVAAANAEKIGVKNIFFHEGSWCDALPTLPFDGIVSNPPYIAVDDPHLKNSGVRFEPLSALVSGRDGMDAIRAILKNAQAFLKPGGYLLLEHGFDQAEKVRELFAQMHFHDIVSLRDLAGHERASLGFK